MLLVVQRNATHRGEVFIALGSGAEQLISNATAQTVVDSMLPGLRQGQYSPAIDVGTRMLTGLFTRALGSKDSVR